MLGFHYMDTFSKVKMNIVKVEEVQDFEVRREGRRGWGYVLNGFKEGDETQAFVVC